MKKYKTKKKEKIGGETMEQWIKEFENYIENVELLYIYGSHLGGFYVTEEVIEEEICEVCGDSDNYLKTIRKDKLIEDMAHFLKEYLGENYALIPLVDFIYEEFPKEAEDILEKVREQYLADAEKIKKELENRRS